MIVVYVCAGLVFKLYKNDIPQIVSLCVLAAVAQITVFLPLSRLQGVRICVRVFVKFI